MPKWACLEKFSKINLGLSGKRGVNPTMKEKLSWFAKYQQQKENQMKKLLPGKTLAKDFLKYGFPGVKLICMSELKFFSDC